MNFDSATARCFPESSFLGGGSHKIEMMQRICLILLVLKLKSCPSKLITLEDTSVGNLIPSYWQRPKQIANKVFALDHFWHIFPFVRLTNCFLEVDLESFCRLGRRKMQIDRPEKSQIQKTIPGEDIVLTKPLDTLMVPRKETCRLLWTSEKLCNELGVG